MTEHYHVVGNLGRNISCDPHDLAADLNSAGLCLIAEYDDHDDEPGYMVAEHSEVADG